MMQVIQFISSNSEADHQLHERLNAAEQRNKELEMLRQAEKQASDEWITALQQRVGRTFGATAENRGPTRCCSEEI